MLIYLSLSPLLESRLTTAVYAHVQAFVYILLSLAFLFLFFLSCSEETPLTPDDSAEVSLEDFPFFPLSEDFVAVYKYVSKDKINRLSSYLREHYSVIFLVKPISEYDFEFELMTESNDEFYDIMKELRTKFSKEIKSYDTVIFYSEPKTGQYYNF